jgi:hypothetical protein
VRSTHSWLQPKAPSSYPGVGLLTRGAFQKPSGPERFSFPPLVNSGSQRWRTSLAPTKSGNIRLLRAQATCNQRPASHRSVVQPEFAITASIILDRRLRGGPINNRGALAKSSGTQKNRATLSLTGLRRTGSTHRGQHFEIYVSRSRSRTISVNVALGRSDRRPGADLSQDQAGRAPFLRLRTSSRGRAAAGSGGSCCLQPAQPRSSSEAIITGSLSIQH